MRFGITEEQRIRKNSLRKTKLYSKLIPHKVFLWWPAVINKQNKHQQWNKDLTVWLERVWRVYHFNASGDICGIYYFETQKEATQFSKELHSYYPSITQEEEYIKCVQEGLYINEKH